MRLIPEYEPVSKLYLSFAHEFFNTRFAYGKTICEIIAAAQDHVDIELFVAHDDLPHWEAECARWGIALDRVTLHCESTGRPIMAEGMPIFGADEAGAGIGLVFRHPFLDLAEQVKRFGVQETARLGFRAIELGFEFATALLAVNQDLVLLSARPFAGTDGPARLDFFRRTFPNQCFHVVPALAGDITHDLDMFLWPVAPRAWVVSEYPPGTPQADSIEPTLRVLADHGHTAVRVPGLAPIIHDDINTVPNYANGITVNGAALVPQYGLSEDAVIRGILMYYGYEVFPIDCSNIILSNAAIHCISKTVPRV